jgi:SAF domain
MATTLTRNRPNQQPTVEPLRFLGNTNRRRPVIAVASLVLITFCMTAFSSIYLHAGDRVSVLVLAHDVPQGQVLTQGDLSTVKISLAGRLDSVSAADVNQIVGRTASVPLLRGTLLGIGELSRHGGPAKGMAIVGVATKVGQLPAGGVADGDTVNVILTGSPATLAGGIPEVPTTGSASASGQQLEIGGVLAQDATVTGVAPPQSSSPDTIVVSVLISSSLAPLVASASAAGQAALVLVGPSS